MNQKDPAKNSSLISPFPKIIINAFIFLFWILLFDTNFIIPKLVKTMHTMHSAVKFEIFAFCRNPFLFNIWQKHPIGGKFQTMIDDVIARTGLLKYVCSPSVTSSESKSLRTEFITSNSKDAAKRNNFVLYLCICLVFVFVSLCLCL